jgi:phosphatidylglycerophosphate synthase
VVQTLHFAIRWVPNAISVVRILLIPIGLWVAESIRSARLEGEHAPSTLLALLLILLGVSDLVDGWIARRYGLITRVGATLDAVADKLAQVAFVSYFTFRDIPSLTALPLWFFTVVLLRDVLLAIGYFTLRAKRGSVDTEHRAHGKISSLLLFFVILSIALDLPPAVTIAGCWTSAAAIAISTAAYLREGTINLRKRRSHERQRPRTSRAG